MNRHLVAGYDGSPDACAAVRWAAAEAASRDIELLIVTGYRARPVPATSSGLARALSTRDLITRDRARAELDLIIEGLRLVHPNLLVSGRVIEGPARRVLVEEATHAELLVVGVRGSGDDTHSSPAMVARSLIHASPCPLVLVPADVDPAAMTDGATILVAVDGTPKSTTALDWAADEAARRGASLTIVNVWQDQARDGDQPQSEVARLRASAVLEAAAQRAVQRAGPIVRQMLIEGVPARDLPSAVTNAELVVVGSRVDRGLHVSTPGSVAEAVVEKARRPIAVVTARSTGDDTGGLDDVPEQTTTESDVDALLFLDAQR